MNLLEIVSEMVSTGHIAGGVPEVPNVNEGTVVLGKRPESLVEVKQRLDELRDADTAELRQQREALLEEAKAEEQTAKDGIFDLRTELQNGATKEELTKRRLAGEMSGEIAQIKRQEAREVTAKIERIQAAHASKSSRVNAALSSLELATKSWAIELIKGGPAAKLHNERVLADYKRITGTEAMVAEAINDPDLAARVVADLTRISVPDTQAKVLWELMSPRNRKEIESPYNDSDNEE